jgi:hypothetical protein
LPGVSIEFTSTTCEFTLAQAKAGIDVHYNVVVSHDIDAVTPHAQETCEGPDSSGLLVFEDLSGNGLEYCLCDTGFPCTTNQAVTIKTGVYPGTFHWLGVSWSGPSDTMNPYGPPFPAGDYTLDVSAVGLWSGKPYSVSSTYLLRLVP